jgi:hypothetical protein
MNPHLLEELHQSTGRKWYFWPAIWIALLLLWGFAGWIA